MPKSSMRQAFVVMQLRGEQEQQDTTTNVYYAGEPTLTLFDHVRPQRIRVRRKWCNAAPSSAGVFFEALSCHH